MFWIAQDPSSGSDNLCLIEITYNGSHVLTMCLIGVWQRIVDCNRKEALVYASSNIVKIPKGIRKYKINLYLPCGVCGRAASG